MQLYSKTIGSGPPLIILHGLLGMSDNWHSFAKQVADRFTVILVDLRNHGRSPHHSTMSYPGMAEDVQVLMENSWLYDGAIVLGHSMGGKVAIQLAASYPDWVDKLIVVDIAPRAYKPSHQQIFDALESVDLQKDQNRNAIREKLEESLNNPAVIAFLMKNLSRTKEGYRWKMNLSALANNYPQLLAAPKFESVDVPTLFVSGEKSDYINQQDMSMIRDQFTQVDFVTIPDAGHWIHADKPDQFREQVLSWLDA